MNALVGSVPQLMLPNGADQHVNGVATAGVSLRRLPSECAFATAAAQVATKSQRMPPPSEVFPAWPRCGVRATTTGSVSSTSRRTRSRRPT
jgi:hypothetical protein